MLATAGNRSGFETPGYPLQLPRDPSSERRETSVQGVYEGVATFRISNFREPREEPKWMLIFLQAAEEHFEDERIENHLRSSDIALGTRYHTWEFEDENANASGFRITMFFNQEQYNYSPTYGDLSALWDWLRGLVEDAGQEWFPTFDLAINFRGTVGQTQVNREMYHGYMEYELPTA